MPVLRLNAQNVNKLPLTEAGQLIYRDDELQGFGVRVGTGAVAFFVEKRVDGRNVRHTLGQRGQLTADEARKLARIKLGEMTKGVDLNAASKASARTAAAVRAQKAAAANYTLSKLCQWYVDHQQDNGKESATDARGLFRLYVDTSEFANLPAREFTAKQATALLRRVIEAKKVRTAAKLRAYLRAAYALAQRAETDAQAPSALVLFGIETNPIASTGAIASNNTREVTLTEEELGEVMRLLRQARETAHDDALAAIELSLWLGGQRLAQVLRLTEDHVDLRGDKVTLLDGKGKRKTPRKHVLPLSASAKGLVKVIMDVRRGANLFGDPEAPTTADTVARKGAALLKHAQDNLKAGKRPKIEARDLRRTSETMLAAMGISKDVRAQLLSHGLGGVQDRHYDQHTYLPEKRAALEAWERKLIELRDGVRKSNVKRLKRAAR